MQPIRNAIFLLSIFALCFIQGCRSPQAPPRTVSETWVEAPDPSSTKVRIITHLPPATIRNKIKEELQWGGFTIEPPSHYSSEPNGRPITINSDGSISFAEPEVNHFNTKPKEISEPPRTMVELDVYLTADTIVTISGRAGPRRYNMNNPDEPYVEWKDITYGNGEFSPFILLTRMTRRFPEGKVLYNKFE